MELDLGSCSNYQPDIVLCIIVTQTSRDFNTKYNRRLEETNHAYSIGYAQAFDAIWTIAQVLNYTEEMTINQINRSSVHENCRDLPGELVHLDKFNYSNAFMGCVIKYNFYKVNFTGVTVSIDYRPYNNLCTSNSNFEYICYVT